MSDATEKTCPLCTEEMDLTDQQLKPCQCGYEICVWCWHHVMDMAEKDATEGRCPACRTPYDKEKIVGMAAKCERLVAEVNMEKKFRSQKGKAKSFDGRKQLTSVRVIQRNLVYIVGLPLNLADEDLLQHREYFGQYGQVLKVSMSRTAAGVIQQFPNNTCSVYITYSKEEEAIRCIQNVHQFVLEGKPLRACFGTTKYCHAWLRNVPCTNPDCLYLHEIGSQEDSFTKDEIISAFTRSRVQQITGAANNMQHRSGNVLPVPLDDSNNNGSATTGKSGVKNAPSPAANIVRGSPPNGCSGRSIALPAAASWGTRGSNCQTSPIACSDGLVKQKTDTVGNTLAFSSAVAGTTSITSNGEEGKTHTFGEETHIAGNKNRPEPLKLDSRSFHTERLVAPEGAPASIISDSYKGNNVSPNKALVDHNGNSCSSFSQAESDTYSEEQIEDLSSNIPSMSFGRSILDESSAVLRPGTSVSEKPLGLPEYFSEWSTESIALQSSVKLDNSINGGPILKENCDWGSESQSQKLGLTSDVEEDAILFGGQRLQDPGVVGHPTSLAPLVLLPSSLNQSGSHSLQNREAFGASNLNVDSLFVDKNFNDNYFLNAPNISATSYNYAEISVSRSAASDSPFEHSFSLPNEVRGKNTGRLPGDAGDVYGNGFVDKGESSIISNILSLDFDVWDNSLTSPQNLVKFLGETDKESGSLSISSPRRAQNNSQSRFSFARQEESRKQALDIQSSFEVIEKMQNNHPFSHDYSQNGDVFFDRLRISNGFYPTSFDGPENRSSIHSLTSSNKFSPVTRAQISAPPGFSVPSRAPPPGFSSHERADQSFDNLSGNHPLDNSLMLRNAFMSSQNGTTVDTGDIEFMDPAILAVGKGRLHSGLNNLGLDIRSNFPPQIGAFENDHARLQLLMQRSITSQQSLRFPDVGDGFSHLNDSYAISSRLRDQSQAANNLSHFAQLSLQQSRNGLSNGHWDGWNEIQGGNGLGMAGMFRNDRVAFNNFYPGYEDSKLRMHSSGDLYNRTFGM